MSSRISPTALIDLAAERAAVERLRVAWGKEVALKNAALASARLNHSSPGADYWKAEALARARYVAAVHILEVLES